jgi:hypothetical protein
MGKVVIFFSNGLSLISCDSSTDNPNNRMHMLDEGNIDILQ